MSHMKPLTVAEEKVLRHLRLGRLYLVGAQVHVARRLEKRGLLRAPALRPRPQEGWAFTLTEAGWREPLCYECARTGKLVPCPGAAHSNAFIDNCLLCAPAWGEVAELAPVDFDVARRANLDVPLAALTDAQLEEAKGLVAQGRAEEVMVNVRSSSFFVLRWNNVKETR